MFISSAQDQDPVEASNIADVLTKELEHIGSADYYDELSVEEYQIDLETDYYKQYCGEVAFENRIIACFENIEDQANLSLNQQYENQYRVPLLAHVKHTLFKYHVQDETYSQYTYDSLENVITKSNNIYLVIYSTYALKTMTITTNNQNKTENINPKTHTDKNHHTPSTLIEKKIRLA